MICDYFRRADIIFRPKYRPGRNADVDQPEGQFFAFFRSKIHTPVFRIIIANVIQMIYLALLVITIENPNKKEVLTWYTFLTATFTIFFVLEDGMRSLQWKNFRRSFWNPYSLVLKFSFLWLILIFGQISHLMILLGGLIVFIHSAIQENDQEKVAILSKSKELLISVSMMVNNICGLLVISIPGGPGRP